MKASVVERVIQTLKSRLEKYFSLNKTKKWVDVIDQIVKNYNSTPHRSIGMAPNQVSDKNSKKVFNKLFPDIHLVAKPRLKSGNIVRILKNKSIFDKGYAKSWSDELYKIERVKQSAGRVWYTLSDSEGGKVTGIHYYWALNLVAENDSKLLIK